MRNLGGAIGIAGCGTILNDRANLHFLRLAEHLNSSNPAAHGAAASGDGRRNAPPPAATPCMAMPRP